MKDYSSNDLEREYGAMFEKLLRYITRLYIREFMPKPEDEKRENAIDWFGGNFSEQLKQIRERVKNNVNLKKTISAMKTVFENADKKVIRILKTQATKQKVILPEIAFRPSQALQNAIKENAALISTIADKHKELIEQAVHRAVAGGANYLEIIEEIKAQTDKSIAYARFVAADQLAKTYGAINMERQLRAGVKGYIWIAKNDRKTRPTHRQAANRFYEWDKEYPNDPRPRDKNGKILHPSQDYRCRCIALPSWGEDL